MKPGPKPKATTRGAEGVDLRRRVLTSEYKKRENATEVQKFTEFMTALDSGQVAVTIALILRLSSDEKARFDQFAKEWTRKKLENVTSQLAAQGPGRVQIICEQSSPGFRRSTRMLDLAAVDSMEETQAVENPFPIDIHSTSPSFSV